MLLFIICGVKNSSCVILNISEQSFAVSWPWQYISMSSMNALTSSYSQFVKKRWRCIQMKINLLKNVLNGPETFSTIGLKVADLYIFSCLGPATFDEVLPWNKPFSELKAWDLGRDCESIITSGCENIIKAPSLNSMTHHQSFLEDYESSYFLCDLFFICRISMWFEFCCKILSHNLQ